MNSCGINVLLLLAKKNTHTTINADDEIYIHCISGKQTLDTKKITPDHSKLLQEALTVVNFISNWVLNYPFYSKLCKAMECNHEEIFHVQI